MTRRPPVPPARHAGQPLAIGRRGILATGLAAAISGPASAASPTARPAAPWVGCAVKSQIYDLSQVDAFEHAIGRPVSVLLFFQGFAGAWNGGRIAALAARGLRPMMTVACGPDETLGDLIAGRYDPAISTLARFARGTPMMLRVMHEMNGVWTSYGRKPGEFVTAWKHVHSVWRAAGNDAPFVWTPNISGNPQKIDSDLAAYYPGDEWCDIVGLDGYRTPYFTIPFDAMFGPDIEKIQSFTKKPLIIAEVGADPRVPGTDAWIDGMFRYLERKPAIRGLNWWARDEYVMQPGPMSMAFADGLNRWIGPV